MTTDGRHKHPWNRENWLVRVESRADTPQASWRRVEWQYDALGRRIRQTTWTWLVQSNLWVVTEDLKFVRDPLLFGRHVVDLNATNNALVRSYVWGLDLSATMDGAGGVGGLLWVTLHTASGPAPGTHFAAYDGNGNVVALSAASDGSATARYEYAPFGEPIRLSGPAAPLNPFRFSTKRTCNTTDLVLYEYRAYSPSLGRWPNRDPLQELGGFSLYGFARNNSQKYVDPYGLNWIDIIKRLPLPPDLIERIYAWLLARLVDNQYVKVTKTENVECPRRASRHLLSETDEYVEERNEITLNIVDYDIVSFRVYKPKKHLLVRTYGCCYDCWGFNTTGWHESKDEHFSNIASEGFDFGVVSGEIAVKEHSVVKKRWRACKQSVAPTRSWTEWDWPKILK
jgi:RHS repeat-associated protein